MVKEWLSYCLVFCLNMLDIFVVMLFMCGVLGLFGMLGKFLSGLELVGASIEAKSSNGGLEISFGFMFLSR